MKKREREAAALQSIEGNPAAVADLADVVGAITATEVRYVVRQLRTGRINGISYTPSARSCGCLLGAIATKRGIRLPVPEGRDPSKEQAERSSILLLPETIIPDCCRPSEGLFFDICPGDKPGNSAEALAVDSLLHEIVLSNPRTYKVRR